jgi:hypothetical protein
VRRKKKSKAPPRRGKDETREGFVYVLLKWPLLIVVLGWLLFLSISYVLTRCYVYLYEQFVTWRGTRNRLRQQLQSTTTYEDWIQSARELDTHLRNDAWKTKPEYAYYDSKTITRVYDQLVKLRLRAESDENGGSHGKQSNGQSRAVEELRALLEACIKNSFCGFENPRLYSETYYGTKDAVQRFVDEAETSLSFLLRTTQLDSDNKRALFKHLGSNFGRTALCLSGGATVRNVSQTAYEARTDLYTFSSLTTTLELPKLYWTPTSFPRSSQGPRVEHWSLLCCVQEPTKS